MVIDGDKYDFMSSEADREIVLDQIVDKLKRSWQVANGLG